MTNNTTVEYKGIEFDVQFHYQPFEKQTLEHEGCPEEITIEEIEFKGEDFMELLENDLDLKKSIISIYVSNN